jgi:hypothetical protein
MNAGGRVFVILVSAALLLLGCATKPGGGTVKPAEPKVVVQPQQVDGNPVEQPQGQEFVASEELYRRTFSEVQLVIAALTRIIADGDYDQWVTYLTTDYVRTTSSLEFLAEASNSGVLKKNGIVLRNLRDYFNNVVVRSRLQATLDDITFVDATHVKAITRIQDSPVILYYLVRENGRWKVGILRAGQN